jgi:tripartite-type tricarboxylate transporter receptor subunit TctC
MAFPPRLRSAAPILMLVAASVMSAGARAEEAYPSRTMTIVVPSAPGGAPDIGARLIAKEMTNVWKVPVVVDNRPGSSGILASSLVARAPKDGYTMLLTFTAHVQLPSLNSNLPYDAMKDFVAVSQTSRSYSILAVPADFPADTVQEFVAKVKASPTPLSYGSSGAGTTSHIYGDLFDKQAGTRMNHVP